MQSRLRLAIFVVGALLSFLAYGVGLLGELTGPLAILALLCVLAWDQAREDFGGLQCARSRGRYRRRPCRAIGRVRAIASSG